MSSIKTVALSGAEVKVEGLGGQNTNILNLGSAPIYASSTPRIVPDADGVAEIPAGGGVVLYDTRGTVYLYGTGRAQLTGSDYNTANFKVPSSPGGGGGGSGGVSQAYVDARDAATLTAAKKYADEKLLFSTFREFPNIGEADKLYIDTGAETIYIWDPENLVYVNVSGIPDDLTIEVTI